MKRFFRHFIALVLIAAFLLLALVQPAAAAYWKQKFTRFSATAGETLSAGDAVYIDRLTGYAWKAATGDNYTMPVAVLVGKGGAAGASVEVVTRGIIDGMTPASPGRTIWASTSAGGTGQVLPEANQQALGFVMPGASSGESTRYMIEVQRPAHSSVAY